MVIIKQNTDCKLIQFIFIGFYKEFKAEVERIERQTYNILPFHTLLTPNANGTNLNRKVIPQKTQKQTFIIIITRVRQRADYLLSEAKLASFLN